MANSTGPQPPREVSIEQIVEWLCVLVAPASVVEMRVIANEGRTTSQFYQPKNFRQMARDAVEKGKAAKGVYFTLNPLPRDQSTPAKDVDVRRRRWMLVDFDPKRKGTVSSTDSEKRLSRRKMLQVKKHLSDQGWPEPVIGDSGNGWHLVYRIDLPNNDTSKSLVNNSLKALAKRFSDEAVDIDTKVGNAARICKLYGTVARKGESTADRPHSVSRLTQIPDELIPVTRDLLEQQTDAAEVQPTARQENGDRSPVRQTAHKALLEDARSYLRKCDPAVSGSNGHTTTLNTAQKLLGNFPNLTDDEAFILLSEEWNPNCDPPWSEGELRRKVDEARKTNPHSTAPTRTSSRKEPSHSSAIPRKRKQNGGVSGATQSKEISPEAYRPFPVDAFPDPLKQFVEKVAQAIGCDPAFVAVPMLPALAAAIGNSRRIELKKGWSEPAIVWSAIIGESGSQKTPAFKQVVGPIRELQEHKLREFEEELADHNKELTIYEREQNEWKGKRSADDPPEKPERPKAVRYIVSDATMEALAPILADNTRGVFLVSDELAGWVNSFNRCSKGNSDSAQWLSIFSGDGILVDRKTGDRQTISIPHPAVSVTGGIQPATLQRTFGPDHRESGLLARVLFAYPPRRTKQWTEDEITLELQESYARIIRGLLELQPALDDDRQPQAIILPLTPAAKNEWIQFYNQHAVEQSKLVGDEAAAWSKLEGYAARFALFIHCVRVITDDPTLKARKAVDRQSIRCGITLSRWFAHEARRVYAMLRESEDDRDLRQIAEKLALRGKAITARHLRGSDRQFPTSDDAEQMLQRLVDAGFGSWKFVPTTPKGGRPTREYLPKALNVLET